MQPKIEELVERRAAELHKWGEGGVNWVDMHEGEKKRWLEYARIALSDPDLALIEETCYTYKETNKKLAYVTPLAEAIGESKT